MNQYVADASIIAAMARELRAMQSLERRGLASIVLVVAGFQRPQIEKFLDRALDNERQRRLAFSRRALSPPIG
jgi:hypothetical protein